MLGGSADAACPEFDAAAGVFDRRAALRALLESVIAFSLARSGLTELDEVDSMVAGAVAAAVDVGDGVTSRAGALSPMVRRD